MRSSHGRHYAKHVSHAVDIERALKNNYSTDARKRGLQLEAKAHIAVQKWIDDGGLKDKATSLNSVRTIHSRFCDLLPPDMLWVEDPDSGEKYPLVPGELRTRDVVRLFLQRPSNKVKVVFSTYQSSPVVGAATVCLPPFDVGVFDEAHKTVGLAKSAFGFALFDDKLAIRKRLFFTATPRHYNTRKRDKDGDLQVVSMDDEAVYGPRAHTLTFGEAVKLGVICPYKVIISLIDKRQVDDFVRRNGITLVDGDPVATQWVSNQIALEQAVSTVDARTIITFHSRVNSAEDFASETPSGMKRLLPEFEIGHVNGTQGADGEAVPVLVLERLFYRRTFMRTYEWHISGVKIQKIYAI